MARGFARISVGQVHYRDQGAGEPLLLLHETPRSFGVFAPIYDCLAERFRVVAMDTPGYGESATPASQPGMAGFAGYVGELLDALGIAKTHILGRHTGASIAVEFAALYPDRVDRLILDGLPDYDEETRKQKLAGVHFEPLSPDGAQLRWAWEYADRHRHGKVPLDLIHSCALDVLKTAGRPDFGHEAVFKQLVRERIPHVTAKTLLVSATGDVFPAVHESLRPLFPNASTAVIECHRHPTEERPAEMCRLITDFLTA